MMSIKVSHLRGALWAAVALTMSATATAQNKDEFSNQVEVTRAYDPEVSTAQKIAVIPNMVDTVTLKPVVNYAILPTQWETAFALRPIRSANISMANYDPHHPFYLRVGVGFPMKSVADIYITAPMTEHSAFGFYMNHDGQWGKIKNDLGDKRRATAVVNKGGIYFTRQYERRSMAIDAGIIYRSYKPYGAFELPIMALGDYYGSTKLIGYSDAALRFEFGDSFTDMRLFNLGVGVGGSFFSGGDKNRQADFDVSLKMGQLVGYGALTVAARFDYTKGLSALSDYDNYTISVMPEYRIERDKLTFALAADFLYDSGYDGGTFTFVPNVELRYRAAPAFIPYFTLGGGIEKGDYRTLSYMNPYILNGTTGDNSLVWRGRVGFGGSVSEVFTYDLYFGAEYWKDYRFFANVYSISEGSTRFTVHNTPNARIYYPGAGLNLMIARGLNLSVSGKYNILSVDEIDYYGTSIEPGIAIPDYEINVSLRYSYRNKFFFGIDALFCGKTHNSVSDSKVLPAHYMFVCEDIKGSLKLDAEAEYSIRKGFSVFLRGENLLNQNITLYNHYPIQGVSVMGGVKVSF